MSRPLAIVAAALAMLAAPAAARRAPADETRALWVVRTTLTSPSAVEAMVEAARAGGFNTLLVQVRGRGDAYYADALEPQPPALAQQPGFDPLALATARAHAAGLRVHAWINLNLVAGVNDVPSERDHVVRRHPEWLMVPRALVETLAGVDPRSPAFLDQLSRHVRERSSTMEGLYLSPIVPAAAEYTVRVVRDIAERYPIDGVHLDYARYPAVDFDYGREALAAFRDDVVSDLGATDRQRYDRRLAREPLIYTEAFPLRWRRFRSERLTELIARVRTATKAARPDAMLTAAVLPDAADASDRHLQDWHGWIEQSLLDAVCPMAYTTDAILFGRQVAAARAVSGGGRVWAGIGAYRLTAEGIVGHVQAARRAGAAGVALFSYDSLAGPERGPGFVSEVGRAAFAQ
jgi:uncharacterized lipoprotein YddW (UPF0748 family)